MAKTTIQVDTKTLNRLKFLKRHPRESYEEILNYLIDEFQEEELTSEEIEDIKIALEEVKKGQTFSLEQVAKELGIKL